MSIYTNIGKQIEASPNERFKMYFEVAKEVYCQIHSCNKVTQKDIVVWYNKKYNSSLTQASLSKYLNGDNEIPVKVYINMKELAGVEDLWLGAGATKDEYDIAFDIRESLDFIKDEVESLCQNPQLQGVCGSSISRIMNIMMEYCEAASKNDYMLGMRKLEELQNEIYDAENIISNKRDNSMMSGGNMKKSVAYQKTRTQNIALEDSISVDLYDDFISRFRKLGESIGSCIRMQGIKR